MLCQMPRLALVDGNDVVCGNFVVTFSSLIYLPSPSLRLRLKTSQPLKAREKAISR